MYTDYSEIYTCEPCILNEDRAGHDVHTYGECKTAEKTSCRGEVNEDIPLKWKIVLT